jgi:hypothetical protein
MLHPHELVSPAGKATDWVSDRIAEVRVFPESEIQLFLVAVAVQITFVRG